MDIDHGDADLAERLDRSFGDGPTHLPPHARVVAGQRALLRRRIVTGLLTAAVVVSVIGTSFAVAGADEHALEKPGYAASVEASADPSVEPSRAADAPPAIPWRGEFVRYDRAFEVELRPGAEVLERIENPFGYQPPQHSVGLTVTWKGTAYWVLLDGGPKGGSAAYTPAEPEGAWSNLADWVADQVAVNRPGSDDPAGDFLNVNVRFDEAGQLVPDHGFTIVEQRTDIDMPDNFAPTGATTAVALVEGGGERRWWLGRIIDGQPDYIDFPAEPGQTVEQFLAFARGKYDAGVGLR